MKKNAKTMKELLNLPYNERWISDNLGLSRISVKRFMKKFGERTSEEGALEFIKANYDEVSRWANGREMYPCYAYDFRKVFYKDTNGVIQRR